MEGFFEAGRATVRGSRHDARACPSEQQCSPIEPDENVLQLAKMVQERGRSTLQPKMPSHTIENRLYAMSLDRPDISFDVPALRFQDRARIVFDCRIEKLVHP